MNDRTPEREQTVGVGREMQMAHYAVLGTVCALVVAFFAWSAQSGWLELWASRADGTYYNLLVQGFRDGQLNLKREAPPGLAQLADPYDPAANEPYRWMAGNPLHDLSYYKGKFYLYFGATPALVLFWPYYELTGRYLLHKHAVVIFCAVGFLAGAGLLFALWRRYFSKVGVCVVAAGMLALGLATGTAMILPRCDVYEVSVSCGYALTMLALAAVWRTLHEAKRQNLWLAAASFTYGLAVGARPSLLFGAVILLVPVVQAWREKGRVWTLLLAATGPIMLIGLGLMLYNTLRFDSPFEFGWSYQLGTHRQNVGQHFSLHYLWFNFLVYFLEPMRWSNHFPFVQNIAIPSLPAGHFEMEVFFGGVLITNPLAWLAITAPLAWRGRSVAAHSTLRWFLAAVALLFGICTLTLCLFYATLIRYEVELLSTLMLLAVLGIFGLEYALAGRPGWRLVSRWVWGLLLVSSVAFNLFARFGLYEEVHCRLGNALSQKGQVDEAIVHFQKALAIRSDDAQAHNGLGVALLKKGLLDEAIPHYRAALKSDPRIPVAHYNLANALLYRGQLDEAINHYQKALDLRPDYAEAHNNFGYALLRKGQAREAIAHYQMALQIQPDFAGPCNNLAWVLATCSETAIRNGVQALELAQRANQLSGGQNPVMLKTLAAAFAEAGRFPEATAAARQALELAAAQNNAALASDLRAQIELYRTGSPFRDNGQVSVPARSSQP